MGSQAVGEVRRGARTEVGKPIRSNFSHSRTEDVGPYLLTDQSLKRSVPAPSDAASQSLPGRPEQSQFEVARALWGRDSRRAAVSPCLTEDRAGVTCSGCSVKGIPPSHRPPAGRRPGRDTPARTRVLRAAAAHPAMQSRAAV
jgi:hypothetical protein